MRLIVFIATVKCKMLSQSFCVTVPPSVKHGNVTTDVVVGHTVWLDCQVSGIPLPTIQWYKDGREIKFLSSKYQLHDNGTLRVNDLKVADSGTYLCIAVNKGGVDERTVNVSILGKRTSRWRKLKGLINSCVL